MRYINLHLHYITYRWPEGLNIVIQLTLNHRPCRGLYITDSILVDLGI